MSGDGDILRMPGTDDIGLDTDPGAPPRTRGQIIAELALALPHLLVLLGHLLRDPKVPRRRKIVAGVVAAYVVSPIDLIPDVIPVLGQIDDVLVVALAIDHLVKGAPDGVVETYWPGSEDALDLVTGMVAWAADLVPAQLRRLIAH
ncbi:MAG: YkvA family protein [Acidimicrobiia bacterium]